MITWYKLHVMNYISFIFIAPSGIWTTGVESCSYEASALPPSHRGWISLYIFQVQHILDISNEFNQQLLKRVCQFFIVVQYRSCNSNSSIHFSICPSIPWSPPIVSSNMLSRSAPPPSYIITFGSLNNLTFENLLWSLNLIGRKG